MSNVIGKVLFCLLVVLASPLLFALRLKSLMVKRLPARPFEYEQRNLAWRKGRRS